MKRTAPIKLTSIFIAAFMQILCIAYSLSYKVSATTSYTHLFPVKNGHIAYLYGKSSDYFDGKEFHTGVDIHADSYDLTIYSACNGTVDRAEDPCNHWSLGNDSKHYNTFGNYIRVHNNDGTYSYYGHLAQKSFLVSVGDKVVKGQALAVMGSSGSSSGRHLHYEVRKSDGTTKIDTNSDGGVIGYTYTGYGKSNLDFCAELPNDTYYLKNKSSGKYLTIDNNTYDSNISVKSYSGNDMQKFILSGKNKYFTLSSMLNNKYNVNPYYANKKQFVNEANLTLYYSNKESGYDQHWCLIPSYGGYIIRNMENASLVIAQNGDNARVETKNGSDNQIWVFESATNGETYSTKDYEVIKTDTYYLKNKSTGKYLTVDEKKDDANISASEYTGSEMQKFVIGGAIGNTYKLSPIYNSSLGVSPLWFTNTLPYGAGNNVVLYPTSGETNNDQHWGFEAVSDGYILHNMKNDTYVIGLDGNNAQLETKTGADDQIWILESASPLVYFNVNGKVDGIEADPLGNYVKFDLYLNGELAAAGIGDYYKMIPVGTEYEIKNIQPADGYSYAGMQYGSLKGTVSEDGTAICFKLVSVSSNSPQIIIESVSASPGNDLKVKIAFKNNPGLASLKLTLTYGDDLTLTSIKYGSSLGGTSQQPQTYSSPVILNWYNGVENTNGDIEYAELSFKLSASAVLGNIIPITATFNPNDVFDINEKNISFAVVNGSVTVNTHTPGDINDDGELNNKDVVQLFKYLSGWDIKINLAAADCNGDGERDNKDVVILFKYLSGWNVEIK